MTTASPRCRRVVQGSWVAIPLLLAMAACGPTSPPSPVPQDQDDAWWTAVQEYVDLMAARRAQAGDDREALGSGAGALQERLRHRFAGLAATYDDDRLPEGLAPRNVSE